MYKKNRILYKCICVRIYFKNMCMYIVICMVAYLYWAAYLIDDNDKNYFGTQ